MATEIIIDVNECIGCNACFEICPEVFGFDTDFETAFVLEDADSQAECLDEATASCPAECISRSD